MPYPDLHLEKLEPWVLLTTRRMGDDFVVEMHSEVDGSPLRAVVDEYGRDRRDELTSPRLFEAGWPLPFELFRGNFQSLTERRWPRFASLPVYVDACADWPLVAFVHPGSAPLEWFSLSADSCQFVSLPRPRESWQARRAPNLPLVIRAIGADARAWIEPLRSYDGFRLQERSTAQTASGGHAHVVVFAGEFAGEVVERLGEKRPELLLCVGGTELEHAWWLRSLPARTSAVVQQSGRSAPEWVEEFLYALTHDLPIHEAAYQAGGGDDLVLADPVSNHHLRLVRVLDRQRRDEERLAQLPTVGEPASFLERARAEERRRDLSRADDPVPEAAADFFSELAAPLGMEGPGVPEFDFQLAEAAVGQLDFVRETRGLEPLAGAQQAAGRARHIARRVQARLAQAPDREWIEQNQERSVQLVLERRLEDLLARDMMGLGARVAPHYTLASRRGYLLRLRIGRPFPVPYYEDDAKPPPIDPALPPAADERGHTLEVAVFGLDFTIKGPAVRRLQLPRTGTTDTLCFEVETPAKEGDARLRVSLYHQNNLIQSFRLEARIHEGDEEWMQERVLHQVLEVSRTRSFTGVDAFERRDISIAVNDSGGTHTFMVKTDGAGEQIALPEALLDQEIARFRSTLAQASADGDSLRFTEARTRSGETNDEFDDAIRELATSGGDLFRRLSKASKAMKAKMRLAQESAGTVLQAVRHDLGFAFPWAGLYDFELPRQIEGAAPAPVCRGEQKGRPCGHGPEDAVFCVRGFWGVRHRIEQLMGNDAKGREAAPPVRAHPPGLALGVHDAYTEQLQTALSDAAPLGNRAAVLDALWNGQGPGIMVVLGHVETNDISGEPKGTRLVVAPAGDDRWLQAVDVYNYSKDEISDPGPIVLLLGCGTAGADPRTLNDLFTELIDAGVAGIVGTECVTFVEPVVRFAEFTISALRRGEPLGESVRAFREQLAREGSPLGFTFTAFGSADLRL